MTPIDTAFEKEWETYGASLTSKEITPGQLRLILEAMFAKAFIAGFDHCQATLKGEAAIATGKMPLAVGG